MTEHRMYLPLAAVVILAVFGFDSLCDRLSRVRESAHSSATDSPRWRPSQIARIALATGLVLLCTYRTYARNYDYRSAIAIWEDTAAKVPSNARARNNYGNMLVAADRPLEALREFEAAINLRQQDCDPYFNRSLIEEKDGDLRKAVLDMAEAVRYCPFSEYYVVRRATLLMKTGDPEQAALEFSRALKLAPGSTLYHYERGNCYMELGKYKDAIRDFTQVVIGEPDAYRAWHNRGNMYAKLGQLEESIRDLSQAIALRPDLPEQYGNRAASYYENRQYDLAWADVEQCRQRGGTVDPELLRLLEERAPRSTSGKQ